MKDNMKKLAFTLAEVLITLGIIGIIAEILIPGLFFEFKKTQYVLGLKKTYSVITEAVKQYTIDNGCIGDLSQCSELKGSADPLVKWNAIKPYLKLIQDCGIENGCFPNLEYRNLGNDLVLPINYSTDPLYAKGMLSDGTVIGFYTNGATCQRWVYSDTEGNIHNDPGDCFKIYLDVNGTKGPNQKGRDLFALDMYTDLTIKRGEANGCTPDAPDARNRSGGSCADRIIREGWEMNY